MRNAIRTRRDLIVGIALAVVLAIIVAAATWGGDVRQGFGEEIDIPARFADDESSAVAYKASYGYCRIIPLDEMAADFDVSAEPAAVAAALAAGTSVELRDASFEACLRGLESLEGGSAAG